MASVTFPTDLGGSGLTVSGDGDPNTGLANGGHRVRFVPALQGSVDMAFTSVLKAQEAFESAQFAETSKNEAEASSLSAETARNEAESIRDETAGIRDDAIQEIGSIKDDAQQAAAESEGSAQSSAESASESLQYRNEAQEIVAGDVAITSLQPGNITQPKDYVTADESGAIAVRNVADDIDEQMTAGEQSASVSRIDYALSSPVGVEIELNLENFQAYEIDASASTSVNISGIPDDDRVIVVMINVHGNSEISWPSYIQWDDGPEAPPLGDVFTRVMLVRSAGEWTGNARARG